MSKEVKRFTIGTFHAAIVSAGSECVLASDYEALLAERDALKALLVSSREFVAAYVNSSFFGPNARKQLEAIDAAMQGEQP